MRGNISKKKLELNNDFNNGLEEICMTLTQELKDKIIEEVKLLENIDDCVGIEIGNNQGLFIQVVDYGEGKEYLVELNNIVDGAYEPCGKYNVSSDFGNMEELIITVSEYLCQ